MRSTKREPFHPHSAHTPHRNMDDVFQPGKKMQRHYGRGRRGRRGRS